MPYKIQQHPVQGHPRATFKIANKITAAAVEILAGSLDVRFFITKEHKCSKSCGKQVHVLNMLKFMFFWMIQDKILYWTSFIHNFWQENPYLASIYTLSIGVIGDKAIKILYTG